MNRTLTAAVALVAGLGMAGLAHAKSSAGPSTTPTTMNPTMPSTDNGAPNAMQNQTGGTAQGPQANAQDQTQGQMGQGQMGQGGRRAEVQQAQQQLKSQGLYRGAVDGIDGPGTRMALRRFQKEQGLRQSAQLDQQTLDRLNGANSGMNGNATPPTTVPNATGTTNTGSGNFNNGHTTGTTTPNR